MVSNLQAGNVALYISWDEDRFSSGGYYVQTHSAEPVWLSTPKRNQPKLLREAARLFDPLTYTEADLRFPLYDGDDEDATGVPAAVQMLADQIAAADAVVISTPEYNAMLSGVLKNALDWISRTDGNPWLDKPVAVMSAAAGRSGGVQALTSLRAAIRPFQPRVLQGPDVAVAASGKQFDDDGQLISEHYTKTLTALMAKLRAEVAR